MKKIYSSLAALLMCLNPLSAAYIQVYSTTDNGGLSWTGNALGLNKATNQNQPGTAGSIGAFITTNTALQVGTFPPGTTLNWALNNSSAVLDLPAGSTVLHAELVWSGSYGYDPAVPLSLANTPITFITPDLNSHVIAPNPATAQNRVETGSRGFYVRSADVTSLVTGGGTFTVGGVPATAIASENANNCAGWTLQVAYENPNCLTSNMSLFVACERAGDPPVEVTGFHAPDTGAVTSRLFVCALEGDAQITGDHLLVGAALPLTYPADRVSGTNNPPSNFFASQLNTLLPLTTELNTGKIIASGSSVLDTRGTFGNANSLSSGTSISGARQGYDITSVDLGNKIANGQELVYVQGTTTGDGYTITGLGLALQVDAPVIRSTKAVNTAAPVSLNQIVQFTIDFENVGGDASALVFRDILPLGLTYVPGSFTLNGTPVVPNLVGGTPIGNLASGQSATIVFSAQVTQINPPISFTNAATIDYDFVPFLGQQPLTLTSQTNDVMLTAVALPPPVAGNDNYTTTANTTLNGSTVLANDTGTDISILTNSATTVPGGSVSMSPDGTFIYNPPPGFSGQDTFTYQLQDAINQTSNVATVTITVLPNAIQDTSAVGANTTLDETTSVLSNDIGTNLVVTSYENVTTAGGTVVMLPNGTYVYNPPLNFSGVDSFNYTATDNNGTGNSTSTQVIITVLPPAQNDFGMTPVNTELEGTTYLTTLISSGATLVSFDLVSNAGGIVTMNPVDGSYIYNPPANYSGLDTFNYTYRDSNNILHVATVTITVTPLAVNNTGTTTANIPLIGTSVLTNDLGTTLSVLSYDTESVYGGTVTMNTATGTYVYTPPLNFTGVDTFTYTIRDGLGNTSTATVSISLTPSTLGDMASTYANTPLTGPSVLLNDTGSALQISSFTNPSANGGSVSMNADGTYSYIPPLNFSGIDTFTYIAVDGAGNFSTPTLVTITVLPLATNDSNTTQQNTPLQGPSVLTNDAGSSLVIIGYQTPSQQGGTVVMNADGTYSYTPPLNFVGVDTFTYTIQDGIGSQATATVTILVTPLFAPQDFVGVIKKCHLLNKTEYRIAATWTPGPVGTVLYRIYLDGAIFAVVSATGPLSLNKCLPSKGAAARLQIASVNGSNVESARTQIRIVQ